MAFADENRIVVSGLDGTKLSGFSPVSLNVQHQARLISAPVESGTMSFDNKVRDPRRIIVGGYVTGSDAETISQILRAYENRTYSFCSVTDVEAGVTYSNLALQNFPFSRETEKYDLIFVELNFQEILLVGDTPKKTSSQENGDTVNAGYTPMQLAAQAGTIA